MPAWRWARVIPARRPRKSWRISRSIGGRAQWAPNEKVALEVALGVAFAGARAVVDDETRRPERRGRPVVYRGVHGRDRRVGRRVGGRSRAWPPAKTNRTTAATPWPPACRCSSRPIRRRRTISRCAAIEISERWHFPVLLRMTTRVCHSRHRRPPTRNDLLRRRRHSSNADVRSRVMIPCQRPARASAAAPEAWPKSPVERNHRR